MFGKLLQLPVVTPLLQVPTHNWASVNKKFTDHVTSELLLVFTILSWITKDIIDYGLYSCSHN